ncbi:hypothetical protein M513_03213 [Trichuris suis]|uniref:Uncharacterized protein n=1 Tax=Trichuris suis TaxID=68888 RepID=A0A085LJD9_9BILA|nr:hypothetical protein M513_14034 [Trichuris suis]KFD55774.1 hypothetical protein M513_03213 [Trichuris suis]
MILTMAFILLPVDASWKTELPGLTLLPSQRHGEGLCLYVGVENEAQATIEYFAQVLYASTYKSKKIKPPITDGGTKN